MSSHNSCFFGRNLQLNFVLSLTPTFFFWNGFRYLAVIFLTFSVLIYFSGCIIMDETDGRCNQARQLVERLHSDMSYITMLGGKELELLTDMDPESLSDIDRLALNLKFKLIHLIYNNGCLQEVIFVIIKGLSLLCLQDLCGAAATGKRALPSRAP